MDNKKCILLLDNGSTRPEATLSLRALSQQLTERCGQLIYPVSLMHSNKIPAEQLNGVKADIFKSFLEQKINSEAINDFLVLPVFYGRSRALTSFIPDTVSAFQETHPELKVDIADVLCPLPEGERKLSDLLLDHIHQVKSDLKIQSEVTPTSIREVVLVDHGSPIPEVTAVRHWLAKQVQQGLGTDLNLSEAVMEKRSGREYAFNGHLLEEMLLDMASKNSQQTVIVSLLFTSPGRHAGDGGDIQQICEKVQRIYPDFKTLLTSLVGEHPLLLDILEQRFKSAIASSS